MQIGILGASAALACLAGAGTAGAQTAPCDQCAKLDTINASIEMQTTEVKSIRRQGVDKLVPQVDKLVLQGDALALKIDKLVAASSTKGAVVIDFGSGATDLPVHTPFGGSPFKPADTLATEYCVRIGYTAGKSLITSDINYNPSQGVAGRRQIDRLVCYM
jgi:hypothetical protein